MQSAEYRGQRTKCQQSALAPNLPTAQFNYDALALQSTGQGSNVLGSAFTVSCLWYQPSTRGRLPFPA
jgi:hypothetical protein